METYWAAGQATRSVKYWPYRDLIVAWRKYTSPAGHSLKMPMTLCADDGCKNLVSLMQSLRHEKSGKGRCSDCFHAREEKRLSAKKNKKNLRPYRVAYTHLLSRAKKRRDADVVTYEQYLALFPPDVGCHYCGKKLFRGDPGRTSRVNLDRLDNTKGYIIGNVAPCCPACNTIKGSRMAEHEMLIFCAIYAGNLQRTLQLLSDNWSKIQEQGLTLNYDLSSGAQKNASLRTAAAELLQALTPSSASRAR